MKITPETGPALCFVIAYALLIIALFRMARNK